MYVPSLHWRVGAQLFAACMIKVSLRSRVRVRARVRGRDRSLILTRTSVVRFRFRTAVFVTKVSVLLDRLDPSTKRDYQVYAADPRTHAEI